ncbi:MAG: archaemetzincin family Zn-dependent metalloprotease [Thermodesulfobacteriota bacterium]
MRTQTRVPIKDSPKKGIIAVLPMGRAEEDVLTVVGDSLQGLLRLPVDLLDPIPIPQHTFMEERNQYNAMGIIKFMDQEYPANPVKILGVTRADLCNPILTYVFGEAYMGGKSAVMSYARLHLGEANKFVSREQFLDRVVKVAIHEIGHTFNLPHCHQGRCVMRPSNTIPDLDSKLNYLCPYCELFLFEALSALLRGR